MASQQCITYAASDANRKPSPSPLAAINFHIVHRTHSYFGSMSLLTYDHLHSFKIFSFLLFMNIDGNSPLSSTSFCFKHCSRYLRVNYFNHVVGRLISKLRLAASWQFQYRGNRITDGGEISCAVLVQKRELPPTQDHHLTCRVGSSHSIATRR